VINVKNKVLRIPKSIAMKVTRLILLVSFIQVNTTFGQFNKMEIANQFYEAYKALDFLSMVKFWNDSIKYHDPIALEILDFPATLKGKEALLKMYKNQFKKKPNYFHLNIIDQFLCGDYVVSHVIFESSISEKEEMLIVKRELFTILKIQNGKIVELYNYGDYFNWNNQGKSNFIKKNDTNLLPVKVNVRVVKDFIKAYSQADVEVMSSYYADSIDFKDLTAKSFFKGDNYERKGKKNVKLFWKNILVDSKPKYVNISLDRLFYASEYVMISTRFSMILPSKWTAGRTNVYINIPIKTIFQIKGGKIVSQYDFADYNLYEYQTALQK